MIYNKAQKDLQMHFMAAKKANKTFWFEVHSCIKKSALTAVKRDAKFKTRYVRGVPLVNRR